MPKKSYQRKSTQSTILIKSKSPGLSAPDDFFSVIFYKTTAIVEKAQLIYDAIVLNESPHFIKVQNNISDATFYEILRRLKGVGLISKEKGIYRPSNRFKNRLVDIAHFPEKHIAKLEEKHQMKAEISQD